MTNNFEIKCQCWSIVSYIWKKKCWSGKWIFKIFFLEIYRSQTDYAQKLSYVLQWNCTYLSWKISEVGGYICCFVSKLICNYLLYLICISYVIWQQWWTCVFFFFFFLQKDVYATGCFWIMYFERTSIVWYLRVRIIF
jgi:hypothetical protein